jgi:asparagine synthase (glutamine-hydrolysing)
MCGIAGLACLDPGCSSDHRSIVARMCDRQEHRGPDDSGIVAAGRVCLGSRRLSIIDLSPAGHMPMSDESGRWRITYNGEVYNFESLREELLALGHTFRSRTDTEVVLHAWMEWGEGCVDRFVGMYAFAVYDGERDVLTLVRDRYGIKPLYYSTDGGHFMFASELKAIATERSALRVDHHSLLEWSLYRNVDALTGETLVEGVSAVLPGHRLEFRNGHLDDRELYAPPDAVSPDEFERFARASKDEIVAELGGVVEDAVRMRLVSDVPVGTLCSGGLDSSLITALAARHRGDLKAFNVSVRGYEKLDENRYARSLTEDLGLELVTLPLTGEAFRRELPRAVFHSDLPLTHPNSVAYFLISRVAREHGVIVLLSGEGADELFGGYRFSYRRKRFLLRIRPLLDALPARARGILALLSYSMAGLPATHWRFRELLPPTVGLIDRYARSAWLERCERAYGFVEKERDRAILGTILADLSDFLAPLLRRLDRMTMAASVECRVPFLDHRVVHRAIQLPLDYRVGSLSDKWVLKQVAKPYLPAEIVRRRKLGFPLPLEEYLGPLFDPTLFTDGFCVGVLGLEPAVLEGVVREGRKHVQDAFGLIALEIWGRMFFMGETVEDVQARIDRLEG